MLRVALIALAISVVGAPEAARAENPGSRLLARTPSALAHQRPCKGRKRAKTTGKFVGWPVPDKELRAEAPARPSGYVHIYSINYKIEAEVNIYNEDGSYNEEALSELEHVFRCKRSGREHAIDPRLITILSHIYDHFGDKRLELLSGYRYQKRTTSNHFHGTAADIRVPGVDPKVVRGFVSSLDAGGMGVGYYPKVGFVHVDVRQPPSFRWIDYSKSNPDAADKQPPKSSRRRNPET